MRITSWNFLHGQRLNPTENKALPAVLSELGSDVLALQEIDMNLERSGATNQPVEIADAMGAAHWGFAPTVCGTPGFSWRKLSKDEERVITTTADSSSDLYGIAIVSSVPVKQWLRYELGKAWIGMPLLIANEKGKVAPFYVKDEPRVALAAVLENGWTVINVHLSFVPLVNLFQLLKVTRWAKKIEREHATTIALVGDFNLPWGIPTRVTRWKRATNALSYPSWKPAISFDHILLRESAIAQSKEITAPAMPISDHRPLSIDITL
jgi:endonuclease/exonuclease/phosphatase family metal-dependent hydrolase